MHLTAPPRFTTVEAWGILVEFNGRMHPLLLVLLISKNLVVFLDTGLHVSCRDDETSHQSLANAPIIMCVCMYVWHTYMVSASQQIYISPLSPFFLPSCCNSFMCASWLSTCCRSAAILLSPELARSSRHRPCPCFCSLSWSCLACSIWSALRSASSLMPMRCVIAKVRRVDRVMGVRRERVALRIVRGAIVGALRLGKGVDERRCLR